MAIQVAIVVQENAWSGSIALLMDLLAAAGNINLNKRKKGEALFECHFIADSLTEKRCFNGLALPVEQQFHTASNSDKRPYQDTFDAVILPAVWGAYNTSPSRAGDTLTEWLQYQHTHGAILLGLVTGPFYLAAAGLLARHKATLHWAFVEQFRLFFPQVELQTGVGFTQENNCWCASDISSSLELGILLVEHFYGERVAQQCQRYLLHNPLLSLKNADAENSSSIHKILSTSPPQQQLVKAALEIMQQEFQQPLCLQDIAQRLNTTTRTLNRQFDKDIGLSTIESLNRIRLEKACQHLRNESLAINLIAYKVGFQSTNTFCRAFKKRMRVSAREYRKTYCVSARTR